MEEIITAMDKYGKLGDLSRRAYTSGYKRLLKILGEKSPVAGISEKSYISAIDGLEAPPKSKEALIAISIILKTVADMPIDKLLHYRDHKLRRDTETWKMSKNETLRENLPSKATLDCYLRTLLIDKNHVAYIVNFLLIQFGVRNKDLDLILTYNKDVVTKSNRQKINYLYVTKKYVTFIRNDYKTHDRYGQMSIRIERQPLVRSCVAILEANSDVDTPLLGTNGRVLSEDSLGKTIQRMTYDDLGEGNYYKVNIYQAIEDKNIQRLRSLAKTRPHSLDTLFKEYNIKSF